MSLTTDHQQDDLEVRRRRKEARKATAPSTKPAPPSAAAARGLLGGLITGGADRAADRAPYSPQRTPGHLPGASELASSDGTGETVDRLVERVRNGAAAIASRQPDRIRPRRPAGTAELPADAAPTRRGQAREERSAGGAAPRRSVRKWTAGSAALVVGIGLVVIALNSVLDHGSRNRLNISAPRTTLAAAHAGDIGLDLLRTIGNTAAEVRALAGSVTPRARAAPPRRDTRPRPHRQIHLVGRDEAAHATRTTLGAAPPSQRTQPAVTQSPVAPPESTAHQPVVTSHSSSSASSSQSTGNNSATSLFGGIGSCVKGCS